MKVNELRAGNLVSYSNKLIRVEMILKNWIESDYSPFGYIEYDKLVGVPLTEEWLLKFGLTKEVIKNETWHFKEDYISTNLDRIWIGNNEFSVEEMPVHRLQNIHYSLYREELCLKQTL